MNEFGNRASKTRTGNSTTTAAAAVNACESLMCQALLEKPHCQDCFHQCGKREIPMSILQTKYWDIYAYHEAVKCVCSGIKKKKKVKVFISCSERCHYQSNDKQREDLKKPEIRVSLFSKPKEHEN